MFQIKSLVDIDDMKAVQKIENAIWNTDTPIHQTFTAANNGGMVLGAYKDGELVGFQYSFAGYNDGNAYLCSHMLAILPQYQKSGVGKLLKEAQRELAIQKGYSLIRWTYDPLESVNAYLNLHKLRGIGAMYHVNYYGEMNDALNRGLPSDRVLVQWWIQSDHVQQQQPRLQVQLTDTILETKLDAQQFPYITAEHTIDVDQPYILMPIPDNFQAMRKENPELAYEWRMVTRKIFQTLLEHGFVAADMLRHPDTRTSVYVFVQRSQLAL